MSIGSQLAWDDAVLPFQLDASDIRGRVARLDGVLQGILKQHDYPPQVEALVAEMALLTALIGQTVKLRWKLSLQVQSKATGVRMIATDYFAPESEGDPARIRAYASFDKDTLTDGTPFEQLGEGYFAILIDQGKGTTPYQGITPLDGGSLAACAEAYFAQSEQLPTQFAIRFGRSTLPGGPEKWRGGGIMLQVLPEGDVITSEDGGSGEDGLLHAQDVLTGDAQDDWVRLSSHLATVDELELIGPSIQPTELLLRLFNEDQPRIYPSQSVRFGCTCSAEKVRDSLATVPADEVQELVTEAGVITADCQFCGAHYEFDPKSLHSSVENGDDNGSPDP